MTDKHIRVDEEKVFLKFNETIKILVKKLDEFAVEHARQLGDDDVWSSSFEEGFEKILREHLK